MAQTRIHPTELELSDYLDNRLDAKRRGAVEEHLASCDQCLGTIVAAHDAVEEAGTSTRKKKGLKEIMKKINIYLALASISFALSFVYPRYFMQLLVATIILGIKWVVDAKTSKMLVMIYDAWKNGGEKEASRIMERLDSGPKKRF